MRKGTMLRKNMTYERLSWPAKCSECGKRFVVFCDRRDYGYQHKNKLFCSYTCFRKCTKPIEDQHKARMEREFSESQRATNDMDYRKGYRPKLNVNRNRNRRLAVIADDVRYYLQNKTMRSARRVGQGLIEAREMLTYGEWLPWLKSMEMSTATAENYMLYARQVPEGSWLADLPYSKALALLRLAKDEREQLAREHDLDNIPTSEIKRLVQETKKSRTHAKGRG